MHSKPKKCNSDDLDRLESRAEASGPTHLSCGDIARHDVDSSRG